MTRRSWVLICLLLAAPVVVAQSDRGVPPDRAARRWEQMGEAERDRLRGLWKRFEAMPAEQRGQLKRRLKSLDRLRERHRRADGRDPSRDVLEQELRRARRHLQQVAPEQAAPAERRRALEEKTRRRIRSFLDMLVRQGRLPASERRRLAKLPAREFIREGLALKKREALSLARDDPERERLRGMDPLDVAGAMRQRRRQKGLLGAAGQQLKLTPAERRSLARDLDEGHPERVLRRLRPRLRRLLRQRDLPPEEIERVLALPLAELERHLHRLLRDR